MKRLKVYELAATAAIVLALGAGLTMGPSLVAPAPGVTRSSRHRVSEPALIHGPACVFRNDSTTESAMWSANSELIAGASVLPRLHSSRR